MTYFLAHLDDRPDEPWQGSDPHEEIYVIPFGEKVATAVPIGALRKFLPILDESMEGLAPACCAACGTALPAKTPIHQTSRGRR